MTSQVVTVEPADSVHDAAELMSDHEVDHVIVVDPVSDRPVGVISTLDVAQVLAGERPHTPRGAYRVAQLMKRNVLTVGPSTPLREVARLLSDNGISGVPVVEQGKVLGVVSETDIVAKERGPVVRRGRLARWFSRGPRSADTERLAARAADEVMTAPAITIESWRTAADAAALMLDRRVHRLPVLEEGKLVGIVSRADLVSAFYIPTRRSRSTSATTCCSGPSGSLRETWTSRYARVRSPCGAPSSPTSSSSSCRKRFSESPASSGSNRSSAHERPTSLRPRFDGSFRAPEDRVGGRPIPLRRGGRPRPVG